MELFLVDRADGVQGRFCVARKRGAYSEFWNVDKQEFCSAGTVYSRTEADIVMQSLQARGLAEYQEVLRDLVQAPAELPQLVMLQQRARQLLIKQTGSAI